MLSFQACLLSESVAARAHLESRKCMEHRMRDLLSFRCPCYVFVQLNRNVIFMVVVNCHLFIV